MLREVRIPDKDMYHAYIACPLAAAHHKDKHEMHKRWNTNKETEGMHAPAPVLARSQESERERERERERARERERESIPARACVKESAGRARVRDSLHTKYNTHLAIETFAYPIFSWFFDC